MVSKPPDSLLFHFYTISKFGPKTPKKTSKKKTNKKKQYFRTLGLGKFCVPLHVFEQLSIDILLVWIVAHLPPSTLIKLRWGVASPNCCIFFLIVWHLPAQWSHANVTGRFILEECLALLSVVCPNYKVATLETMETEDSDQVTEGFRKLLRKEASMRWSSPSSNTPGLNFVMGSALKKSRCLAVTMDATMVCAVRLIYLQARLCEQDNLGTHGLSNPRSPYPCNGMLAHGWKHLHQGIIQKPCAEALDGERPIFQWFAFCRPLLYSGWGLPSPCPSSPRSCHLAGGPVHQSTPWTGSCCLIWGPGHEWICSPVPRHLDPKLLSSQTSGLLSRAEFACPPCGQTCS